MRLTYTCSLPCERMAREAFSQIAEQLKVSPGMIRQRYNRLVEDGYLKVVAITNPIQRGFKTMALIGVHTDGISDAGSSR